MPARPSSRETILLSRLAAGDDDAWARLDRRYRPALLRYAGSLGRPGTLDREDVVQEVLVRAHRELRGGFVPDHLSAWLHRMVRNAAIDLARARARRPVDALVDRPVADPAHGPDVVILRKERLRRVVDDVAGLPDAQRIALVARAVDGRPAAAVAAELGISEAAVGMAVRRARENLIRAETARDADCEAVRPLLHRAHDRGTRTTEAARAHLHVCPACRSYRKDLRRLDRRLRALAPPLLPLLGLLGGGAGVAGVGAKSAAVAGVLALAATGGALVVREHQVGPGQPSPVELEAGTYSRQSVRRGGALPPGTWAVTARVRLPAGVPPRGEGRGVTLTCPAGTRSASMVLPQQHAPLGYGLDSRTGLGERRVRVFFDDRRLEHPARITVGAICRRPDAGGSLIYRPRRAHEGEAAMLTVPGHHYLHHSPGGIFSGTLFGNQPVSVRRTTSSGRWSYVISDDRDIRGWVRSRFLRRP